MNKYRLVLLVDMPEDTRHERKAAPSSSTHAQLLRLPTKHADNQVHSRKSNDHAEHRSGQYL